MKEITGVREMAQKARGASLRLAAASIDTRNQALLAIADGIESRRQEILAANAQDIKEAAGELS